MERTEERSLGELFAELSRETSTLIRKQFELARVELSDKLSRAGRHAALIGIGGALAHAALLTGIAALVLALIALFNLAAWAAALIVGVLLGVGGYALLRSGIAAFRRERLRPDETIRTLKESAEWARSETN
jgi:Flp pilus assembly protein TadB